MSHFRNKLVDLLVLSRSLILSVALLEDEVEVGHRLVQHFNVVQVRHVSNQLLLQVVLVVVLRLLVTHLVLHLENAPGKHIFEVTETLFRGHLE